MRAARCLAPGPVDDLVVMDVPALVPAAHEVLIEVEAAGVNFPDALLVQGRYQVKIDPPFTPGSEVAGRVLAVGSDVAGDAAPQVGDRVYASMFHGAFAELAVAPAAAVQVVPDSVAPESAAAFGVTYATAFHALHTIAAVQPGEWVVILGAAGGVGMAAIDLAVAHGARVVAAASSPAKLEACLAAGAEVAIDYGNGDADHADLKTAIREATGGTDVVVDPVGGAYTEAATRTLRPGGRLVVVGFASGTIPALPLNLVLLKGITVQGVDLRQMITRDPTLPARAMATLFGLLADGRLHPRVHGTFALDDVVEALLTVTERRAIGKVLINPNAIKQNVINPGSGTA